MPMAGNTVRWQLVFFFSQQRHEGCSNLSLVTSVALGTIAKLEVSEV